MDLNMSHSSQFWYSRTLTSYRGLQLNSHQSCSRWFGEPSPAILAGDSMNFRALRPVTARITLYLDTISDKLLNDDHATVPMISPQIEVSPSPNPTFYSYPNSLAVLRSWVDGWNIRNIRLESIVFQRLCFVFLWPLLIPRISQLGSLEPGQMMEILVGGKIAVRFLASNAQYQPPPSPLPHLRTLVKSLQWSHQLVA